MAGTTKAASSSTNPTARRALEPVRTKTCIALIRSVRDLASCKRVTKDGKISPRNCSKIPGCPSVWSRMLEMACWDEGYAMMAASTVPGSICSGDDLEAFMRI